MSVNHKAQLLSAKADFVRKLTTWINQTTENPSQQSIHRLVEAGLMQRILDVHNFREKTTQNVCVSDLNRFFMPQIKETHFMNLRQINRRDVYLGTLFDYLWTKKAFTRAKAETKELVGQWLNYPKYRRTFPYSLLGPGMCGPKEEPERPKEEPKQHIPDAWDDEDNVTPAEEFAALAREFGVSFRTGDNIGVAYKRLALLMHPDKHLVEEADIWTTRMKRLNALREILE